LENAFLDSDDNLYLGDFGVSCVADNHNNTFTGTPTFLAPEFFEDVPYTNKVDIWSLGCIWY